MNNKTIKLTILSDNTASDSFVPEHGFAAAIEGYGVKIIFDTAQNTLLNNAKAAKINLSEYDILVLSHGHYDHTNGVPALINENKNIDLWIHEKIFADHYTKRPDMVKYIALVDETRKAIQSLPEKQKHIITKSTLINENIGLVCNVPRTYESEKNTGILFRDIECTIPDYTDEETTLWIKTDKGLAVITGCCHAGIMSTCDHVRKESGIDKIDFLIGGFHTQDLSDERLREICRYISDNKINRVVPCHCSGEKSMAFMKKELGRVICNTGCGSVFTFNAI